MAAPQQPMVILRNRNAESSETQRQQLLLSNLMAGAQLNAVLRTSLGPKAAMKMLLNPMGGIIITRDGNAIARDLFPEHPIPKLVVEGARAQDDEVGDGTTSTVIYTSGLLEYLVPIVQQPGIHPTFLARALNFSKEYVLNNLKTMTTKIDLQDPYKDLANIVSSTISTKQQGASREKITKIAIDAIKIAAEAPLRDSPNVDIKRNIRVMKIGGGSFEDTALIKGVVIEKDVLHPSMKRKILNPRILIIDCGLEYKKGESQTTIEISDKNKFNDFLKAEEEEVMQLISRILAVKPDIVLCDKGITEMASFLLAKNGITALRRCKMTDLNRLTLSCGATLVRATDSYSESCIGTGCKVFEVKKIGVEYFSFFEDCSDPKACTILVRGQIENVLQEIIRNFNDALYICRSLVKDPKIVPGAGAIELQLSQKIMSDLSNSKSALLPVQKDVLKAFASVLELIPRTLFENAGVTDVARKMLELKCKINSEEKSPEKIFGIDGISGQIENNKKLNIWDAFSIKEQCIKNSFETALLVITIDEIVAVTKGKKSPMQDMEH